MHSFLRARLASEPTATGVSGRSPTSTLRVCEALEQLELPRLIHQGTTFSRAGSLSRSRPILIDEIALRHPRLKIVIAHMSHPWFDEPIAVVRPPARVRRPARS
jgi:predicted TIM-barrel fold metal-dependent hydrolase